MDELRLKRVFGLALSLALAGLCPGLPAYQAAAAILESPAEAARAASPAPPVRDEGFVAFTPGPDLVPVSPSEVLACDPARTEADRRAAVAALAKAGDLAALERVGRSNPDGGAVDYEIKRAALRELAARGKVVSLPPISRAHAERILERLRTMKPGAAAFDYDGTLEPDGADRPSPETGRLLSGAAEAGVETMILSGRSEKENWRGGRLFLDALKDLPASQLSKISAGVEHGARTYVFDRRGTPHLAETLPTWTPRQRERLEGAVMASWRRYGTDTGPNLQSHKVVIFLKPSMSPDQIERAGRELDQELGAAGVPARVLPRGLNHHGKPYLLVLRVDKSDGARALLSSGDFFLRARDSLRYLPGPLQRLYQKGASKLSRAPSDPTGALLVGDEFFGDGSVDSAMTKGAPGALALSVGGTADPRLENVFVWPTKGPEGAHEIARALGQRPDAGKDAIDRRAAFGWLAQSSVSIVAFILTSLAFPLIALPALGPARFATLLALGPLVSIATGPLNGKIIDRRTIRDGMVINTIMRGIIVLDVAVFLTFGLLNFWTLALGAVANGWMLSMIMTTESAYLKGIGGLRNAPTFFAISQVRYLSIQVILNLIIGFGAFIDLVMHPLSLPHWPRLAHLLAPVWGPRLPFIAASLLNFLVVLPLTRWLMPNKRIDFRETGEVEQASAPLSAVLRGLRGKLKPALAAVWKAACSGLKSFSSRKKAVALVAVAALAFALGQWTPSLLAFAGPLSPLLRTPVLLTISLLNLIRGTDSARRVFATKPVRNVILMSSFGAAALVYGTQVAGFPLIVKVLYSAASAGLMLGKLLGAYYFGQLIAYSSQVELPKVHLPLIGRIRAQHLIQAGVLALAGLWSYSGLFPGHLLRAVLVAAGGGVLMAAARRVTQTGFITLTGAGYMAALGLMALFHPTSLLLGALALGFFFGAGSNALSKYFYAKVPVDLPLGQASGVSASFFNGAISLGYGLMSVLALKWAFPAMFLPMGVFYAAVAVLFLLAPRFLPGLTGPLLKSKGEKR